MSVINTSALNSYNHQEQRIQFEIARRIVSRTREWHAREQRRHQPHPAVVEAFKQYSPVNWHQLLLEWPYVSDTDITRLAYTRNERAGIDDKQTLTTVGKYLKQHWPDMPDHIIRDLVAKHATDSTFHIVRQKWEIVNAVQRGPSSCMQWDDDDVEDLGHHPYEHYAPKYGWHMVQRNHAGRIAGRALLMQRDNCETAPKYYVRTYAFKEGQQYSQPCDQLEQWLKEHGYEKRSSWRGERLAFIPCEDSRDDGEIHAPYIDGIAQYVDVERELDSDTGNYVRFLRITDNGEYDCTSTNGKAEQRDTCTCSDCGERIGEDDQIYVGYHGDNAVGNCCIDDYTHVTGRRGNEYYVSNDEAVEVGGDWYDRDYLSDNNIVELHNGDYAKSDDAVYIEERSEYYRWDDDALVDDHTGERQHIDDCVELHNGDYALESEAWQCYESGNYYLTDEDTPIEIDGEMYHEDFAPEQDDEETNETDTPAPAATVSTI